MSKARKIAYWFFTIWLSLGMASTGIVQLIKPAEEVEKITHLGYPVYFLTILGIWKLLGVLTVLAPKIPLLKEWAYAGFFFAMSGAAISHIVLRDPVTEILPSLLLLTLTIISWYLKPESRRFV